MVEAREKLGAVWFFIEAELDPREPDVYEIHEVAKATNRTVAAIKRALQQNRLPRYRLRSPVGERRRRRSLIRASTADLARWRRRPLAEVLSEHEHLPQNPLEWRSQAALARVLKTSSWEARRLITRYDLRRLAWGHPPFRPDIVYHVPDLSAMRGGSTT